MMSEATDGFAARLLDALPALRPRYEATAAECRAAGMADAAPDVVLDEYTRDVLGRFAADPEGVRPELAALAGFLDEEYGRDGPAAEDVRRLIEACFVALLPPAADPDPAEVLGHHLAPLVGEERAWRAPAADVALVRRMVGAAPELERLARDNYELGYEDVLLHRFLADVALREAANVAAGARGDEVRAVLDLLDAEFDDPALEEAIAVSFVENLPYPDEEGIGIVALLGPRLRAELSRQRPDQAP
jgi:hypothetical protein